LKPASKIAIIYLVCGLLWIFFSDRILCAMLNCQASELTQYQTYKGFFFIASTAALLYLLASRLYKALYGKLESVKQAKEAMEESEKRYSDLFRLSPLPIWVYDCATLRFLAVNEAATNQYGYSREEFLAKTIIDIRPKDEVPKLMETMETSKSEGQFVFRGIFKHIKKSGEIVTVEIRSNDVIYQGRKAKVVLVNDISERINYIADIEAKNEKLQQIAHLQSHVVRAPLATMMGFAQLLEDIDVSEEEKRQINKNILQSAKELDDVIKEISVRTQS
jgi:PAS domain S-box-containing protein